MPKELTGSKTEIRPGVWKLRVHTGLRGSNGSPKQVTRTVGVPPGTNEALVSRLP